MLSRIEHILKNRINRNLKRDEKAKWKINQHQAATWRQVALKLETALWEAGKHSLDEYSNLGTVVTRLKMLSDKYREDKQTKTKSA